MSMICLFSPRLFINTRFPLWKRTTPPCAGQAWVFKIGGGQKTETTEDTPVKCAPLRLRLFHGARRTLKSGFGGLGGGASVPIAESSKVKGER